MTKGELKRLFSAWLDGKTIQIYQTYKEKWVDQKNPSWDNELKYRVKPTKIEFEDCSFNEIEYKVDKIGKVVEVRVDRLKINNNRTKSTLFQDKETAEAYAVLPKLIRLRDKYNEGWKPDYQSGDNKFTIAIYDDEWDLDYTSSVKRLFVFKTSKIRDNFFNDYKDLLEIAKPFL